VTLVPPTNNVAAAAEVTPATKNAPSNSRSRDMSPRLAAIADLASIGRTSKVLAEAAGLPERGVGALQRALPDRPIVNIPQNHEIFHLLYDLDFFTQIWGIILLNSGVTYENGGVEPHWRGIYDDQGRLMVAINHNMDLGDAWEHADDPRYPTDLTALAYRFAVNYVIYAMTH
jgi:hypothetical protein